MTAVVSAIGEATGMKPEDKVIRLSMIDAAKAKARAYLGATLAAAKGWVHLVHPYLPVDQMVKREAESAQQLLP